MLTEEQKELRKKFIGGSDIAVVMGHSPYKTAHQLWLEKTGQVETPDITNLPHVQRGIIHEEHARRDFERLIGKAFPPTKKVDHECYFMTGNYDGLSEDNEVAEFKTMGQAAHIEMSLGKVPFHYELKVQWYMMIANAKKGYLVSYRPEDESTHYVELLADYELWKKMRNEALVFWEHVITKTPLTEISDELKSLISAWKAANLEAEAAVTRAEALKEEIKSKLSNNDIEYDGVKITHYEQKGTIDYSRIEVLKTMDLEQYRKATSKRVKFTV